MTWPWVFVIVGVVAVVGACLIWRWAVKHTTREVLQMLKDGDDDDREDWTTDEGD